MRFGVKLGVDLPSRPDDLRSLVSSIEELGFDSIWVGDHVLIPRSVDTDAHATQVGGGVEFADKRRNDILDPIVALTFISTVATQMRIGISVLVVPYRDPVVTAKMLATLDVISGGRLTIGAGVGWMKDEFDALGVPFEARGELTDQHLATMIELWSADELRFEGELERLSGVSFLPKPVQRPHPPIWVGGNGVPAMRRAVRFGQGWMPNFQTPEDLAPKLERLAAMQGDRPEHLGAMTIAVGCRIAPGSHEILTGPAITGTAAQMREEIGRFTSLGVSELVIFSPHDSSPAARLEPLERFAKEML